MRIYSGKQEYHNGFTLVELAIVLMIIGLLVGGILRGQELLTNGRVTRTVENLKSYEAAIVNFRDAYGTLPGDILNPSARISNCTTSPCNTAGDSNGIIGVTETDPYVSHYQATNTSENRTFWLHLANAHLISGVDASGKWTGVMGGQAGIEYPASPVGGLVSIVYFNTPTVLTWTPFNGHAIWVTRNISSPASSVEPRIAHLIDSKMDDGLPHTGSVRGYGIGGPLCSGASYTYNEYVDNSINVNKAGCFVLYKI